MITPRILWLILSLLGATDDTKFEVKYASLTGENKVVELQSVDGAYRIQITKVAPPTPKSWVTNSGSYMTNSYTPFITAEDKGTK